jgi:5-methyltetrahydrofolate--homocysteine methyltransferase
MDPASSVSGFYLGHPDARYFNVGKVGQDQLVDLAKRRNETIEVVQRSLASQFD